MLKAHTITDYNRDTPGGCMVAATADWPAGIDWPQFSQGIAMLLAERMFNIGHELRAISPSRHAAFKFPAVASIDTPKKVDGHKVRGIAGRLCEPHLGRFNAVPTLKTCRQTRLVREGYTMSYVGMLATICGHYFVAGSHQPARIKARAAASAYALMVWIQCVKELGVLMGDEDIPLADWVEAALMSAEDAFLGDRLRREILTELVTNLRFLQQYGKLSAAATNQFEHASCYALRVPSSDDYWGKYPYAIQDDKGVPMKGEEIRHMLDGAYVLDELGAQGEQGTRYMSLLVNAVSVGFMRLEQGEETTLTIGGMPWVVGEDVTEMLDAVYEQAEHESDKAVVRYWRDRHG